MQVDRITQIEGALDNRWTVRRIAGAFRAGVKNGRALESLFHSPSCACILSNGDILICTNTDRQIRVIRNDGIVESLPSHWLKPSGLCSTDHGTAVCDAGHHRVKFLSGDGKKVTSIAGVGRKGFKDGPVTTAEFNNPCSCCYDLAGALFVVDKGNHSIRKIKDGLVTTVAGKGAPGHADGLLAMFNAPSDIAYHSLTGFLFVADTGNHCIRCIRPDLMGVVTVAGVPGNSGCHNGPCLDSLFCFPSSIALITGNLQPHNIKSKDNLYMTNIVIAVADTFNNQIRRIFFDKNVVDTLVGAVTPGTSDGNRSVSKFHHPSWVRFKCSPDNDFRSLIVCDTENNVIREVFMTEGLAFTNSRSTTPEKIQDSEIISQSSRVMRCSPHQSPLVPREKIASPHRDKQKFDFSPRRGIYSRQTAAADCSYNTKVQVAVASIYSGVTHLFQYQHGAYRYVSPCRILLKPADCDLTKPCLEFLEIPSDRVLSACSIDSDVQISVQNLTFVYFTKFGVGCRFGNKSETDKFLDVLRSLSLSLCETEKSAQLITSSNSMPKSPGNYAKHRLDRPFPLEVGLVSPAPSQTKRNHIHGLCKHIAHEIDGISEDISYVESMQEFQSEDLIHVHLSSWKKRLLNCSEQLTSSFLTESPGQQTPIPGNFSIVSSKSLANLYPLKSMDSFGTNGTGTANLLQVSWRLVRNDIRVSSAIHEKHSYFHVSSGEHVKMMMTFRGPNYQVSRMLLRELLV